ncbi:MAG: helix-turn-helix domain-containing protein [Chitinivibrionales bacterium]|nr:helix-turn-helix domain-containing protein [Chitinivibrionales bacterium]
MKTTEKFRITRLSAQGKRRVSWMDERQLEKFRAKRLQAIRHDELGLTQKVLAEAVGANLRTLQDWETGRSPMPKPVEKLLDLMREMPSVRKRLLAAAH